MTEVIYCGISKPKVNIEDWIQIRKKFSLKAREIEAQASNDFTGEYIFTGESARLVHPRDLLANTIEEALLLAFGRGRSPRGILARLDSVSAVLSGSLRDEVGEGAGVTCFIFLSEFGSLALLPMIGFDRSVPATYLPQSFMRRFLETSINKTHPALIGEACQEAIQKLLGLGVSMDFARSFTYLIGIFTEEAANRADVGAVHRLEDGDHEDETIDLSVGELGAVYAKAGWSHSTFVTRDLSSTLFLLPPIVAVDSLYSITAFQNSDLLNRGVNFHETQSLSQITSEIAKYQDRKFNAEILDLERKRLEEQFKPWQRGVYWKLFNYWGMKESVETFIKIHQLTLEAASIQLSEASARIQSRQSRILAWIALFQFAGIGASVLAYLDLLGHNTEVDVSPLYHNWAYFTFAAGLPIVTTIFLIFMARLYFLKS